MKVDIGEHNVGAGRIACWVRMAIGQADEGREKGTAWAESAVAVVRGPMESLKAV